MPLYDFHCSDCDHVFEELVRAGEAPACPGCSGQSVERLSATASVRTGATRSLSQRSARQRDAGRARDRMHERLRYEKSHDRHG